MRTEQTTAFDLWLKRGLAEQYADTLREPISDDLLAVLEACRRGD